MTGQRRGNGWRSIVFGHTITASVLLPTTLPTKGRNVLIRIALAMTTDEAVAHAEGGGRATCDALPRGAVIKTELVGEWPAPQVRVVFEATGDGYRFDADERYAGEAWRKVEGWAAYG